MNEKSSEWQAESARLKQVIHIIEVQMKDLIGIMEDRKADVVSTRKNFWTDISVNMDNIDDILETNASITQQSMVLANQERSYKYARDTLHKLEKLRYSPYFSRIDFIEAGSKDEMQLYIGIGSVIDEATGEHLVFDWRSPIAGMFYDYGVGPAEYEAHEDKIRGEITLKRQFIIKNGILYSLFDTGVHIGDEMLQDMLSRSADDKMKSIVTTIQREQNQIIRDDKHRVLIVQGAAGSGKTSAALQRIAYQLYKHRNRIKTDDMVLISPNALFNDYVSMVLPELGEANVRQTTFQGYLEHRLNGDETVEDPYAQLEDLLTTDDERQYRLKLNGIKWKASLPFVDLINRYVGALEKRGMLFKDFVFRKKTWIRKEQLEEHFYQTYGHLPVKNRLSLIKEWVIGQLKTKAKEEVERVYESLLKRPEYLGTETEMRSQSKRMVRKHWLPLNRQAQEMNFVDTIGMYCRLFEDEELLRKLITNDMPESLNDIRAQTVRRLDRGIIAYEDATPLMYFKESLEGFETYREIRYVVVDEAQDYSPFQYEVLRRVFPRAKMTFLGDLNQGIYAHTQADAYDQVRRIYGQEETRFIRLTKSYRSTKEITEFTTGILSVKEEIEPFSRSGEVPKVLPLEKESARAGLIADEIEEMRGKGAGSIAVICKTAQESEAAYEQLKDKANVHLITKASQHFITGTVIIPSYLAKGLEFDGVIVFDGGASRYSRENERKLFYTVCTRALHWLTVFHHGKLTPYFDRGESV